MSENNKLTIKRIISVILTIVLITAGLIYATDLTRLKKAYSNDMSAQSYFDHPEEYEVLFFGTSHMMNAVQPLELWNSYGIVSYNWGRPSCTLPCVYWQLRNTLDYATPKLVVVDCFRTNLDKKIYFESRLHEAFDPFKLTKTKYDAVKDVMDEYSDSDRYNMLFKLSAYHNRWSELTDIDYRYEFIDTRGAGDGYYTLAQPGAYSDTTEATPVTDDVTGIRYLKQIIELCQSKNIDILLTYIPFPTSEEEKMESNMVAAIAEQYGVDYINYTDLDVVDYDTDCGDSDSHLNVSGSVKITEHIGEYIMEHYDIRDMRDDLKNRDVWNKDYLDQTDHRIESLCEKKDLKTLLMMSYGVPVDIEAEIYDEDIMDDVCIKLLGNADTYTVKKELFEIKKADDIVANAKVYRDGVMISDIDLVRFQPLEEVEDSDGTTDR